MMSRSVMIQSDLNTENHQHKLKESKKKKKNE